MWIGGGINEWALQEEGGVLNEWCLRFSDRGFDKEEASGGETPPAVLAELLCNCVLFLHFAQRFTVHNALRFVLDFLGEWWVQPDLR